MGFHNLSAAFEADSKLIKSRVRSTIKAAMNPSNPNIMLTSIKIDFSNGPLLTGDDPRYIYRSPEMTIEAIPLGASLLSDYSIASEEVNSSGERQVAGADVMDALHFDEASSIQTPFMEYRLPALPLYLAGKIDNDTEESVDDVQQHEPLPSNEALYLSPQHICKWIEHGEKAGSFEEIGSLYEKKFMDKNLLHNGATSFEFMNLITMNEDEIAIREKPSPSFIDSDPTLRSVSSLPTEHDSSIQLSNDDGEDDEDDIFIVRTPFPNGPSGSVEEEGTKNGKSTKIIQCGDGKLN